MYVYNMILQLLVFTWVSGTSTRLCCMSLLFPEKSRAQLYNLARIVNACRFNFY